MKKQNTSDISKLWKKSQFVNNKVKALLGKYALSKMAEDIYIYTASSNICITDITRNSYFYSKSLSTIKRAVNELKEKSLVMDKQDTKDRRIIWLVPNLEV
jgi:hypothetical protein